VHWVTEIVKGKTKKSASERFSKSVTIEN